MISELISYLRSKTTAFSTAGIVALVVAGLVFLIAPQAALSLICRLLGLPFWCMEIILLLRYLRQEKRTIGIRLLILSIILLILGIAITSTRFSGSDLRNTSRIFFSVYGLFSLVRQIRMDGPRNGRWIFCMAGAVFELILEFCCLTAPVRLPALVLRIVGVVFLYAAVSALSYRTRPGADDGSFEQEKQDLFERFRNTGRTYTERDMNGKEIIEGTARDVTDDNNQQAGKKLERRNACCNYRICDISCRRLILRWMNWIS